MRKEISRDLLADGEVQVRADDLRSVIETRHMSLLQEARLNSMVKVMGQG